MVSNDDSHLSRAGQHRHGDPFLFGVKLRLRTPGSGSILGSETSHLHSLQSSILWPHAPRGGCQCRREVRGGAGLQELLLGTCTQQIEHKILQAQPSAVRQGGLTLPWLPNLRRRVPQDRSRVSTHNLRATSRPVWTPPLLFVQLPRLSTEY